LIEQHLAIIFTVSIRRNESRRWGLISIISGVVE
jgi:hypothetical protein